MNVKLTKSLAVAMLSMAALSSAFAASDRKRGTGNGSKDCCVENVYGTVGCEMASGQPMIDRCECNGWYFDVGVLYWRARVGGTEFAYTNNQESQAIPIKGSLKEISYNTDWGFRVGLGYALDHDHWDTNLEFTFFQSSGSKGSSAGNNDIVVANAGAFGIVADSGRPFGAVRSAKSQSNIDYYNFDWELGRAQFNTKYLYFRPHVGLKGCWTDLSQTSRFSTLLNANGSNDENFVRVQDTQDWWGVGPRAGLDSKWFFGDHFNIFGDIAFATLFGLHTVDHREKYSGSSTQNIRVRANTNGFVPYGQIFLGLGYDTYVNNDQSHIAVRVGYEVNYFWRMNQMLRVEDSLLNGQKFGRHSEDVAFQGITGELKWQF